MKHLVIIGARGAGREIYCASLKTNEFKNREYDIKGFLDDKLEALNETPGYPPILGSVENYEIQQDDVFICALGDPKWRRHYVEMLLKKNGEFINIIDPSVVIEKNTKVGVGCIIRNCSVISCDVSIGNFVYIQPFCVIGHDSVIDDFCHLNSYAFMGGYSKLETMSIMQTRATLIPHKKVMCGGVIGAGSVAIRNVKAGTTVMGVPAVNIEN
ncbi:MAG: acetyltransferase [Fibrobacteraceae bacterium]|nr:acetyltransferase [Fibrobacteraceae bacterium]